MVNTKEKFVKASGESIETTREVLKTSLDSIEKLTKANLNASKKFLEETSKTLKEMTSLKHPKELMEKMNQFAKRNVESSMSNCKELYEIVSETQHKISKMLESHIKTAQKSVADITERFSHFNSANKSNFAADAVKSWMNSANQAIEALNKMATQASKFTGTSKPATTKSAPKAAKKTTKK